MICQDPISCNSDLHITQNSFLVSNVILADAFTPHFRFPINQITIRKNHQRCSIKKVVLRNFAKFAGLLFNKVYLKSDSGQGVFL